LTYDYRKLLSHRKIIVRFSCNQAPYLYGWHTLLSPVKAGNVTSDGTPPR